MEYYPQFLSKPSAPVAFPPLLPDRWGSHPMARQIMSGADRSFYTDETIDPNAKSTEFRKAIAAKWASETLKYNPHYFTDFPFGSHRDGNFNNSSLEQTLYLKGMEGDSFLRNNLDDAGEREFDDADYEINPPAHTNANLINNLTIPYIAGEKLRTVNTPTERERMLKRMQVLERDAMYYGDLAMGGIADTLLPLGSGIKQIFKKGTYAELVDRNIKQRESMANPRYLNQPADALGWNDMSSVDPTSVQLEKIRHYRSLIDRDAGVDSDVPWQYNYE